MDPAHAVYVYVQNHVSALVEQLSELKPLFPPVNVIVREPHAGGDLPDGAARCGREPTALAGELVTVPQGR
jgi:hypothetical protein